jgi:hypothetical protein
MRSVRRPARARIRTIGDSAFAGKNPYRPPQAAGRPADANASASPLSHAATLSAAALLCWSGSIRAPGSTRSHRLGLRQPPVLATVSPLPYAPSCSRPVIREQSFRIWGSGVRIPPSAPTLDGFFQTATATWGNIRDNSKQDPMGVNTSV